MGLATQLLRIMLFSFFSFLAANGIGVWDAGQGHSPCKSTASPR